MTRPALDIRPRAVVAVLATAGFVALAALVMAGKTQAFDVATLTLVYEGQHPVFTKLMLGMTYLGTGEVVVVMTGALMLLLWKTPHAPAGRLLCLATIGNLLLNGALKFAFHRVRPSVFAWQTTVTSSSFPSGHAMTATVVYGTAAYLLLQVEASRSVRLLVLACAAVLIAGISSTRVYLGVHYPSDVLGGFLAGTVWATLCVGWSEREPRLSS